MVEQKAAEVGLCDVNQTVSITENFDGKTIDHRKTLPASSTPPMQAMSTSLNFISRMEPALSLIQIFGQADGVGTGGLHSLAHLGDVLCLGAQLDQQGLFADVYKRQR